MKVTAIQVSVLRLLCPLIARHSNRDEMATWFSWMLEILDELPYGEDGVIGTFCRTISLGMGTYGTPPTENSTVETFRPYWIQQLTQAAESPKLERNRRGLRTCLTRNDCYLGLVPEQAEAADSVFVILGNHAPALLRLAGSEAHFKVVGECYIQGIMNGELIERVNAEGGHGLTDIFLV